MPDFSRLELDEVDLRALVAAAVDRICGELRALPGRAACTLDGGAELARSLREPCGSTCSTP